MFIHSGEIVCNICVVPGTMLNTAVDSWEKVLPSLELPIVWCSLYLTELEFVISQDHKLAAF